MPQRRESVPVTPIGVFPWTPHLNPNQSAQQQVVPQQQQQQRNHNVTLLDMLDSLECPVCYHTVLPPIYNCVNGHLICNACRPRVRQCPTCKGPRPDVRILKLERIVDSLRFDCTNQGCTGRFLLRDKDNHEANCHYKLP